MLGWIFKSRRFRRCATSRQRARFLASTSLSCLKPRFKRALRPLAGMLARAGVTANQVTISSLLGSMAAGGVLAAGGVGQPGLYVLLPVWLAIRMALATIDGTLAHDFGQKSRLGGILNEVGDVLSDVALYAPLALVPPFPPAWVALVVVLAVMSELAGMASERLGAGRGIEGPMGKADRSIVFGLAGVWLCIFGSLPAAAALLMPVVAALLLVTIANRVRFAWTELKTRASETRRPR